MPDSDTTVTGGTPDAAASETDAAATGSGDSAAADATLASRYAGQTARVNVLMGEKQAAEDRAAAAERKLQEYEAGKVNADEALRAQLAAEQAKTAAAEQKAALALVKAQYPETFAEFGDLVAGWPEDKLAAAEARLSGVVTPQSPTPKRMNESKTTTGTAAPKPATEKTFEELKAEFVALPGPTWGRTPG